MISKEEAIEMGGEDETYWTHWTVWLLNENYTIAVYKDGVGLNGPDHDESIDISHLNAEQLKQLVSLLTPPVNE